MEDDKKRFPPRLPRDDRDGPMRSSRMSGPSPGRRRLPPGIILLLVLAALGAMALAWTRLMR